MCNVCQEAVTDVPVIGTCAACGRAQVLREDAMCVVCGGRQLAAGFTGPVD